MIVTSKTCNMELFDPRTNEVQRATGLNWGHGNGNVKLNDSCIPIRTNHLDSHPELFPPKQENNKTIELIWDDGTVMTGLLEGSYNKKGVKYPKQIASSPKKEDLGIYLRRRLGVALGEKITMAVLKKYGRNNIGVSLISEGVYYMDFSI